MPPVFAPGMGGLFERMMTKILKEDGIDDLCQPRLLLLPLCVLKSLLALHRFLAFHLSTVVVVLCHQLKYYRMQCNIVVDTWSL